MQQIKIENIPLAVQRGVKFRILADAREKLPWTFFKYWKRAPFDYCNKYRLLTSDYSLEGGQHYLAIERKSAVDLLSTLSLGLVSNGKRKRDRFELELERMQQDVQNCYVIVEAPLSRILQAGANWKGQLAKTLLLRAVVRLKRRYPKIKWEFYPDREAAEARAFYLLFSSYLTLRKDGVLE